MIDFVFPNNNEKEFIKIAEKLEYKTLYFLYSYDDYFNKKTIESKKIRICKGILADSRNINKIPKKDKIFVAVPGSMYNRDIIEKSRANIIFSTETDTRKDFIHHRASGLNHILCRLAHENKVAIGFSLNSILKGKDIVLGRIMQNIKLCRKYKVNMVIGSFTKNPYEMRSPHDIISLFESLGMNPGEAKKSLNYNN